MNLRPHHLLCIQKFTGHGYNESFTAHMTSTVEALTDKPMTQITVTQGCDDLCQMCPNNIKGSCASLQKVALMDSGVLRVCELAYGENIPWRHLADRAHERIFETDAFIQICACCQWFDLCRRTEVHHE